MVCTKPAEHITTQPEEVEPFSLSTIKVIHRTVKILMLRPDEIEIHAIIEVIVHNDANLFRLSFKAKMIRYDRIGHQSPIGRGINTHLISSH